VRSLALWGFLPTLIDGWGEDTRRSEKGGFRVFEPSYGRGRYPDTPSALFRAFLPPPVADPAIPDAFLCAWSRRQCWPHREGTYYGAGPSGGGGGVGGARAAVRYPGTHASARARAPAKPATARNHEPDAEGYFLAATPAWGAFLANLIGGEGQDSGRPGISAFCPQDPLSTHIAAHRRSATRQDIRLRAGHNGRVGRSPFNWLRR